MPERAPAVSFALPVRASAVRRLSVAVAAALLFGAPVAVLAQEGPTPPVAQNRSEPEPPTNRMGIPFEGWVKLRYSVLADGTAADIRVVDVMPPQLPTRDVVNAARRWTFEPATFAGEPIDWHNNESIVVFDVDNVPLEPTPLFAQAYVQVTELIGEEDYDDAKKRNAQLLGQTFRLHEIGLAQVQSAVIDIATSNHHDAYEAILRATDPEVVTLQPSELESALRYRFALELELGHYAASLATFDRLNALSPVADEDVVAVQAVQVRGALGREDAAIVVKGRVDREPWSYAPTRRTFGFTDIDGTVRQIQLECDRTKTALEFADDVEWTIPESWGTCVLFVDARRNTTFSLVEFP